MDVKVAVLVNTVRPKVLYRDLNLSIPKKFKDKVYFYLKFRSFINSYNERDSLFVKNPSYETDKISRPS